MTNGRKKGRERRTKKKLDKRKQRIKIRRNGKRKTKEEGRM